MGTWVKVAYFDSYLIALRNILASPDQRSLGGWGIVAQAEFTQDNENSCLL